MITEAWRICYGRGSEEKLQLGSHDLSCINFVVIEGIVVKLYRKHTYCEGMLVVNLLTLSQYRER